MRYCGFGLVLGAMLVASGVQAHVRIQPAESLAGAQEAYAVRVPTEGDVATAWIELEVPAGVSVISIEGAAETKKIGERIVSIIWRAVIPPGETQEFAFVASNPAGVAEISWKAHQHFSDGSSADWVDGPGTRRPASITKLNEAQ